MIQDTILKNGFILKRETFISEIDGSLIEMEHAQTGAQLIWLDRVDENMTFAIGFRTIPTDSTGVFHILEHSVLGGSEKYPVKEPFVELLKSSLQTFLNAMTFPDKTVYPVSSRNRQDFQNLMAVYMDAVFHPLAVKDPKIFMQEGWRIELSEEDTPLFQGVVYNEMKGALSNISSVTEHAMMQYLFPDTCYRHNSGGDPACIPDLTFKHFQAEHAKYYHPSNALIALDGSIDLEKCLSFLNECFQEYTRQDMHFPIYMQQSLPYSEKTIPYEISSSEDPAGKAIVSYGKILCDYRDPVQQYSAAILADYLSGGSESPLKRAILDAGLGEDATAELHDGIQQYWFGWEVTNTDPEKKADIQKTIRKMATDILTNGLDKDRLLGCYNSLAFHLVDRDNNGYPRGLAEILSMDPWYYGGDPAQNLGYNRILKQVRENMDNGYFEKLLERCLLDTNSGFLAVLIPSKELADVRIQAEKEKCQTYWTSLDQEQKTQYLSDLQKLHQWQQTPDSSDILNLIPMLKLSDVDPVPAPLDYTRDSLGNTPVLIHNLSTNIHFIDLFFNADDLTIDDIPLAGLLVAMLGTLQTKKRSASDLQIALNQKIGRISADLEIYPTDRTHHRNVFSIRAACLPEYVSDTTSLIVEMLTETVYKDLSALKEFIHQEKIASVRKIVAAGNRYASLRVQSRETSAGAAREKLNGYDHMCWISKVCTYTDDELVQLLDKLQQLASKLFVRERLSLSLSANSASLAPVFAASFPVGTVCTQKNACYQIEEVCSEGIRIPAAIGFAAEGSHLDASSIPFNGCMYVLSNYLTYEYLWNAIRVQGGAYGTGFRIMPTGDITVTSYRDPSPVHSLTAFNKCGELVRSLKDTDINLTKYILGAVSDAEPLMGAQQRILRAEARFFRGVSDALAEQHYQELLSTSLDSLRNCAAALDTMARSGNCCLVAGDALFSSDNVQLDRILDLPQ